MAWVVLFGISTSTFHERLTLSVTTPDGPKSASAITTVTSTHAFGLVYEMLKGLTGGATGSSTADGSAIMLEVTPGRWLFVLRADAGGGHSYYALSSRPYFDKTADYSDRNYRQDTIAAFLRKSDPGTAVVLFDRAFPAFVTFDDVTDPSTLRLVNPQNLAATFGPGVALDRLTLSRADGPGDPTALQTLTPWLCVPEVFPTFAERETWTDLDRRHFLLSHPSQFLPSYCGPK